MPIHQILSFNDNTSKAVIVTIIDDEVFECNETFFAVLSVNGSEEKGVTFDPHNASITIENDDGDDDSDSKL